MATCVEMSIGSKRCAHNYCRSMNMRKSQRLLLVVVAAAAAGDVDASSAVVVGVDVFVRVAAAVGDDHCVHDGDTLTRPRPPS